MPGKLLIFGGKGFVGENMAQIAREAGWEVDIADSSPAVTPDWLRLNITDQASVEQVIARSAPDAVVNVAAIADIDRVDREKELAYQVNVNGARFIAEACARRKIRYVFFSSDAVFDGQSTGYREEDFRRPVNYYGQTKLEAEEAILQAYPEAVVIRISLVLGFPITSGNSFFAGLESKLRENQAVTSPVYEIRTPIDVFTLSECVLELCEGKYSGIFHLGATDSISRYDLTRQAAVRMGFDESLILPQMEPDNLPGRSPRHKNGMIDVSKACRVLHTRLLTTQESIERAFSRRNQP
jgi:dTDP-4-dehydrorhamnose reductase